jgi:hypothetical protein
MGYVGEDLANVTWTTAVGVDSYTLQWRVEGTADWNSVPGITTDYYALPGLTACTTYDVQMNSVCSGNTGVFSPIVTFTTLGCGSCIDQAYCDVHSTSSVTEWIEHVMVNGQEHISGNDGGYGDHTDVSFTLYTDAGQQIEFTPGYSGPAYSEWWSVWVDQDQDGQFVDAERLFQSTAGSTTMVVSDAIQVQYFSGSTRMRVAMRYGGNATDACTNFENGEVEDFCVQMEPTGIVGPTLPKLILQPTLADDHIDVIVDRFINGWMQLAIIDVGGRTVWRTALRTNRNTIATEGLAAGHYRCVLHSGDAVIATSRFVVAH